MRYLVTGGSGLIGRFLLPAIERQGGESLDFDLLNGYDVLDWPDMVEQIGSWRPDVVIHLAGVSLVEKSKEVPRPALENNVMGTVNVLEACRQKGIQNVITASTNHVYGAAPSPHCDLYTASKIAADVITQSYADAFGLNAVAIRPTNTYGPNDPHLSHIVPGTITSILQGKVPVIRSDGMQEKSYLYGEDCAEAILHVANYCDLLQGRAVNIVGSRPTPVSRLVEEIQALMGDTRSPIVLGEANDLHDEDLDDSVLYNLGWIPRHSLDEGLQKTIDWFKDNAERERDKAGAQPVQR